MSNKMRDQVIDKLDVRVLGVAIFLTVVEFEVFSFARIVVTISEQDAWISILLGTVLLAINGYILVKLANRFPRENFIEYCPKVWGKPLGYLINLGYILYWFATLTIILKDFSVSNQILFLPKTPSIVLLTLVAIGAVWISCYGLAAILRFFQLMFLFLVIPLLLVAVLGLFEVQLSNLKPFFGHDLGTILKGSFTFTGIYQGVEIILFVAPFLTTPRKMVKPAIVGIVGGTFFPLVLCIAAIGSIGVANLKSSVWSGIDTVSMITLPGFPVERYELFLTMPWLVATFTSICVFLYFTANGTIEIFKIKNRKITIAIVAGLAVASTWLFPNYAIALGFRKIMILITYLFIAIIPLLTLIMAVLRGKVGIDEKAN